MTFFEDRTGKKHQLKPLVGKLRLSLGEHLSAELDASAQPAHVEDGMVHAFGVATWQGKRIGDLKLKAAVDLWPMKKPPGRQPAVAGHIACLAHYEMTNFSAGKIITRGQSARYTMVAEALSIGSPDAPEYQQRQVSDKIGKANKFLKQRTTGVLSGRPSGEGRLFFAPDPEYRLLEYIAAGERGNLDAVGWYCTWGDRVASYGHFSVEIK